MGQDEVIKVLKEKKDWMYPGEIMAVIHSSRSIVNRALKIMDKTGEVEKETFSTRRGISSRWRYKC